MRIFFYLTEIDVGQSRSCTGSFSISAEKAIFRMGLTYYFFRLNFNHNPSHLMLYHLMLDQILAIWSSTFSGLVVL